MKIKIKKKLLRESNFDQELSNVLSKYNIEHEVGGTLGMGKYGLVVPGVSDDYGPVAIKILQSSAPSTEREVRNYKTVSAARNKSPFIKKHFPEVYHIDKSNPNFTLIIMEILQSGEGVEYEKISMLFGGINTALRPTEDEREVAADHDLTFRSRENRYYMMFKDKDSQDSIVQDFFDNTDPEIKFLESTIRNFFSYLDAYVSNKGYSKKKLQLLNLLSLSDDAKTYLNNWMTGKPKAMFEDAPWMMTFIIEQLDDLEQHEDKTLFLKHHEELILFWLYWFRQNSPIGMRSGDMDAYELDDVGAQPDQIAVFKEAESIRKAIMALKKVTGLQAADMHDRNVMIRPQTGDIVIVDLGLFRKI